MEKQPHVPENGVEIPREAYNGLEAIRQSGATNMLDRPMVIYLAREWGFDATADWIENVGTKTYGELIFKGPIVIDDELDAETDDWSSPE